MAGVEREIEKEVVCAETSSRIDDSPQCDRYDEQVDQEQVGGKQPHRRLDVFLTGVLDDHDVELSWEQHNCPHGKKQNRRPTGEGILGPANDHEVG